MTNLMHLQCSSCGKTYDYHRTYNACTECGRPLLARYDLASLRDSPREDVIGTQPSLWRYGALLPAQGEALSLGEGFTPLIHATRLGRELGFSQLYIKDESGNPTGSFKARGAAVAITRAQELGIKRVVVPSAGNAAGATAAYAAKAGMQVRVFMPADVPTPFRLECRAYGAEVTLVEGYITDCAKQARRVAEADGWFDISTFKEPYRIEGKKTMGFELAEQFNTGSTQTWELPDVIIYPTGGGIGLVGFAKAFDELEAIGWIGEARPRMISVQAQGCAPIARALRDGKQHAEVWEDAQTIAPGLRAPSTIGDFLILQVLRDTHGTAVTVSDQELLQGQDQIARMEGIYACPEGGATLAAVRKLGKEGLVSRNERIVLCNTASGLKYPEVK